MGRVSAAEVAGEHHQRLSSAYLLHVPGNCREIVDFVKKKRVKTMILSVNWV